MRILELFVLILSLLLFVGSYMKLHKWQLYLGSLLVILGILTLIFEGLRYEVLIILILLALSYIPYQPFLKVRRVFTVIIIGAMFLLILAFPVYRMPTPTMSSISSAPLPNAPSDM